MHLRAGCRNRIGSHSSIPSGRSVTATVAVNPVVQIFLLSFQKVILSAIGSNLAFDRLYGSRWQAQCDARTTLGFV